MRQPDGSLGSQAGRDADWRQRDFLSARGAPPLRHHQQSAAHDDADWHQDTTRHDDEDWYQGQARHDEADWHAEPARRDDPRWYQGPARDDDQDWYQRAARHDDADLDQDATRVDEADWHRPARPGDADWNHRPARPGDADRNHRPARDDDADWYRVPARRDEATGWPAGQPGRRGGSLGGRRARRRPRLWDRTWIRVVAGLLAAFLVVVSWSVGHALTMPGGGSVSERLAEWARDHYLGPVVTFGEWLTYQPPKAGGKPSFPLTGPSAGAVKASHHATHSLVLPPPKRLKSFAGKPLHGEGSWRVLATVHGHPAIYGTYLRASRVYSSYVAGIAVMNQRLLRFELRPGTEDPGPGNWKAKPYIAAGSRKGLLATFNNGFKINVSGGGFYLNGAKVGTITKGVASEVYYRNGHIKIGVWGRNGLGMTPDVVGVRQNLHLIVSHGHVPSTVDNNVLSSWGATLGGSYYVWRSGIGMTKNGEIVFAYGPALNVRELADLLRRAGAVTAMELDINPEWMSYMYYLRHHGASPTPENLLPTQNQPPNRYYSLSSRDFTAVFAR